MMARIWSKRMLAVSGLVLAVGCRGTATNSLCSHTPSLPTAEMTPIIATGPTTAPAVVLPIGQGVTTGPIYSGIPTPPKPEGATLPLPKEISALSGLPVEAAGPALPPIVLPKDVPDTTVKAPEIGTAPELLPPPKPALTIPTPPLTKPVLAETQPDPFLATSRIKQSEAKVEETKPEAQPAFPLKPGQKYGHADDYRWVAGILDYHQRGGYWTIRYADFAEDDRWGGKVRLVDDERLKNFKAGDLVYASGELLAPVTSASTEGRTTFPPFRVGEIKVIEKAK